MVLLLIFTFAERIVKVYGKVNNLCAKVLLEFVWYCITNLKNKNQSPLKLLTNSLAKATGKPLSLTSLNNLNKKSLGTLTI